MIRTNTAFLDFLIKNSHLFPADSIQEKIVESGCLIITERSNVQKVSIIKSGLAKCYLSKDDGTDFILEFFGPGAVVGEIEMLFDDLSFAAVEAMNTLTVLQIPRDRFKELLTQNATFNSHVIRLLASKVKYKAIRFSFNQTHTLEQNLAKMLQEMPELLDVIAKKDLVNYLGVTERSLNRTLKKLKDKGSI